MACRCHRRTAIGLVWVWYVYFHNKIPLLYLSSLKHQDTHKLQLYHINILQIIIFIYIIYIHIYIYMYIYI